MRVQKNLRGTTGEILAIQSIEHNGIRGGHRLLQHCREQRAQADIYQTQELKSCEQVCDSLASTNITKHLSIHFSILLHMLINATVNTDSAVIDRYTLADGQETRVNHSKNKVRN